MKQILYFLLLSTLPFSISAQKTFGLENDNPNALINVNFFSIDAENPNEPSKMWLSLPDSVKIFAGNEPLTAYKHYAFGVHAILLEQRFLNSDFQIILPNNKTIFKAIAKRAIYQIDPEPITDFFERKKYLSSKGEEVEKISIGKPKKFSTNGESFAIYTNLAKHEKILYLVDNKIVDENFIKKVFQMNAFDANLVQQFGERAKGFDNVFCIWTTDLNNKK
jgi:hypothetical protein